MEQYPQEPTLTDAEIEALMAALLKQFGPRQ